MLDYLAYLWARDITEETVGSRRRMLSEVLEIEDRRPDRGPSGLFAVVRAWGDKVGSAHRSAEARR